MSSAHNHFSPLNMAERRSKLRQLGLNKGQITLWKKGDKKRLAYRVNEFERDSDLLSLHLEESTFRATESVLASFDLNGVTYFLKAVVAKVDGNFFTIRCVDEFYKSERRHNTRILTYPIYQVNVVFTLPDSYDGGKVLDIKRKPGQTGLFKSFLKLVDNGSDSVDGNKLKLRLQDLSNTGLSVYIGPAELDWFKTGEELKATEVHFSDEVLRFPVMKIVYVVDQIGSKQKQYKVGLRFEELPASLETALTNKINDLLKQVDANKDFEDFVK